MEKAKKLLSSIHVPNTSVCLKLDMPPESKKLKLDATADSQVWAKNDGIVLSFSDKESIMKGEQLNDLIINTVQKIIQKQFPSLLGLQSTLIQCRIHTQHLLAPLSGNCHRRQLQIIHSRGNHWMVASTILAGDYGVVQVYDSIYSSIDDETKRIIHNLFDPASLLELVKIPKQIGGQDCGLYAIAISTALAFGLDPAIITFNQAAMRPHLIQCIDENKMIQFS